MPYILGRLRRMQLMEGIVTPENPGELNYVISTLCDEYLARKGGITYTNLNEVLGVMTCAQLEIYRRLAAPYEDQKRSDNGDVFESQNIERRD